MHLAPCILHLANCNLHIAPYTMHLAPCTLHLAPCTLQHAPCSMHLAPFTMHLAPCTLACTLHSIACTLRLVRCVFYFVPRDLCIGRQLALHTLQSSADLAARVRILDIGVGAAEQPLGHHFALLACTRDLPAAAIHRTHTHQGSIDKCTHYECESASTWRNEEETRRHVANPVVWWGRRGTMGWRRKRRRRRKSKGRGGGGGENEDTTGAS